MKFTHFILSVLAFIGFALGATLPKLMALPPAVSLVVGVAAFVSGAAFLLLVRPILLTAGKQMMTAGQVRPGLFILLLMFGAITLTTFAASNINNSFTSLILRPSGTRTSDTNGLVRLSSANESNYFAITTNLDFVFFTANGAFTGRTHSAIVTNINDTATRSTNAWKSGVFVSTNGVIPL
jgi:hypothetical protein